MSGAEQHTPAWQPEAAALTLVPAPMAKVYGVLPLSFRDGVLTVVASDEVKTGLPDIETFLDLPKPIEVIQGTREQILQAIEQHYGPSKSLSDDIGPVDWDFDPPPPDDA